MLIHCFGLYWDREKVAWGRPNVGGTLLGVPAKGKTTEPQDFWVQHGIYVLYNEDFECVYVGQTGACLGGRLRKHTRDEMADRWRWFSWFGLRRVLTNGELSTVTSAKHSSAKSVLDEIEAILIATIEPRLNSQKGRFGDSVERYIQYAEKLPTELETISQEIAELKKLVKKQS